MIHAQAAATSWTRAKRLKALVKGFLLGNYTAPGDPKFDPNVSGCREFLACHKTDGYQKLLDEGKDLRNVGVQEMLNKFEGYAKQGRTSKGDPTRPVRAGATPTRRSPTQKEANSHDPGKTPGEVLTEIRATQLKYGLSNSDLAYAVKILGSLVDK